jgi:hypothetical protein
LEPKCHWCRWQQLWPHTHFHTVKYSSRILIKFQVPQEKNFHLFHFWVN